MKILISFFITFLFLFDISAQTEEVTVYLSAELVNLSKTVGVFVNTPNGESVYSRIFEKNDFSENVPIRILRIEGEVLCLTILSKFEIKYGGIIKHFYELNTVYDVVDGMLIQETKSRWDYLPQTGALGVYANEEKVTLKIEGVEKRSEMVIDLPIINRLGEVPLYTKWKKDYLKIEYPALQGIDPFFLLKSKTDSVFRYLYLPRSEVLEEQAFNYENLPKDLVSHRIEFPDKEKYTGLVKAKNEDTGNWCFLYSPQIETFRLKNSIDLFFPESQYFYDFEVSFLFSESEQNNQWSTSQYFYYGNELPKRIEFIDLFHDFEEDDGVTHCEFDELGDFFEIRKRGYFHINTMGQHSILCSTSWNILGKAKPQMDIAFPEFPVSFQNAFIDLPDESFYSRTEVELFSLKNKEDIEIFDISPSKIYKGSGQWAVSGYSKGLTNWNRSLMTRPRNLYKDYRFTKPNYQRY